MFFYSSAPSINCPKNQSKNEDTFFTDQFYNEPKKNFESSLDIYNSSQSVSTDSQSVLQQANTQISEPMISSLSKKIFFKRNNKVSQKLNWLEKEDQMLFQKFLKYGSSWKKISQYLSQKDRFVIKNRFYNTLKRVARDQQDSDMTEQEVKVNYTTSTLYKLIHESLISQNDYFLKKQEVSQQSEAKFSQTNCTVAFQCIKVKGKVYYFYYCGDFISNEEGKMPDNEDLKYNENQYQIEIQSTQQYISSEVQVIQNQFQLISEKITKMNSWSQDTQKIEMQNRIIQIKAELQNSILKQTQQIQHFTTTGSYFSELDIPIQSSISGVVVSLYNLVEQTQALYQDIEKAIND